MQQIHITKQLQFWVSKANNALSLSQFVPLLYYHYIWVTQHFFWKTIQKVRGVFEDSENTFKTDVSVVKWPSGIFQISLAIYLSLMNRCLALWLRRNDDTWEAQIGAKLDHTVKIKIKQLLANGQIWTIFKLWQGTHFRQLIMMRGDVASNQHISWLYEDITECILDLTCMCKGMKQIEIRRSELWLSTSAGSKFTSTERGAERTNWTMNGLSFSWEWHLI